MQLGANAKWLARKSAEGETMSTALRHSAKCPRCEMKLIYPQWSEAVGESEAVNFWCCPICGNEFETTDSIVEASTSQKELAERFMPSLLVA
jgi:rubredoxin